MTDKLKPCPFCGGKAYLANVMGRNGVCCENIMCDVVLRGKLDATEEDVIKAWNTRKPMDRIVEQLERRAYETADWMCGGTMKAVELTDAIAIVKGVQNE